MLPSDHFMRMDNDMLSRTEPVGVMRIRRDREKAREFARNARLPARPCAGRREGSLPLQGAGQEAGGCSI